MYCFFVDLSSFLYSIPCNNTVLLLLVHAQPQQIWPAVVTHNIQECTVRNHSRKIQISIQDAFGGRVTILQRWRQPPAIWSDNRAVTTSWSLEQHTARCVQRLDAFLVAYTCAVQDIGAALHCMDLREAQASFGTHAVESRRLNTAMGIDRRPHRDVDHLTLAVCVILQERLRVFPACECTDLELAQVIAKVNRDDIVKVRTRSVAENSALLHSISQVGMQHCRNYPTMCVGFSFLLFITNSPCGEMMA